MRVVVSSSFPAEGVSASNPGYAGAMTEWSKQIARSIARSYRRYLGIPATVTGMQCLVMRGSMTDATDTLVIGARRW